MLKLLLPLCACQSGASSHGHAADVGSMSYMTAAGSRCARRCRPSARGAPRIDGQVQRKHGAAARGVPGRIQAGEAQRAQAVRAAAAEIGALGRGAHLGGALAWACCAETGYRCNCGHCACRHPGRTHPLQALPQAWRSGPGVTALTASSIAILPGGMSGLLGAKVLRTKSNTSQDSPTSAV